MPAIYVSQPTENTPAGRMMRRTLANMAAFYTEQQSLDVRDGHARRVAGGLFVGLAPYEYANVRRDGRGLVEVHPDHGRKVRRLFDLYAYHGHTLDSLRDQLATEGIVHTDACPQFPRSKLYSILKDRAYLGEVMYQGNWYAGGHPPLVDLATVQQVQVLLGGQIYRSHESVYGSELVACGHCGHPVTGEVKTKQTKAGPKDYVYYRCSKYTAKDHPRVRAPEADMDAQVLALFDRIKIRDEKVRDWFLKVLRAKGKSIPNSRSRS